MPSSDYTAAIGGGLKLKGVKDAGVKRHKKKKSTPKPDPENPQPSETGDKQPEPEGALQKALADEEQNSTQAVKEQDSEAKEYGKTEAQRRHEERRRKRVGLLVSISIQWGCEGDYEGQLTCMYVARRPPEARRHQDA